MVMTPPRHLGMDPICRCRRRRSGRCAEFASFPCFGFRVDQSATNKSYKVWMLYEFRCLTLPETNSEFTPEKWWLEDEKILLGPGLSSGAVAMLVSGRVSPDDYHLPSQITIQLFFVGEDELLPFIFGVEKCIPYPTFLSKNERLGSEKAFPGAKSPCLISTSF